MLQSPQQQQNKNSNYICPQGNSPLVSGESMHSAIKFNESKFTIHAYPTRECITKDIYSKIYRLNLRSQGIMREFLINPYSSISVSVITDANEIDVLSWAMLIWDYQAGEPGLHVYTRMSARGHGYGSLVAKTVLNLFYNLDNQVVWVHSEHSNHTDEQRRRSALWESLEKHFQENIKFDYLD